MVVCMCIVVGVWSGMVRKGGCIVIAYVSGICKYMLWCICECVEGAG